MKAAVYRRKGVLEVEEIGEPTVGPRDLLLKISHCAVCGSDLHRCAHGMLRPGMVMGHEYVGVVMGRGALVHEFDLGDRVGRCDAKTSPRARVANPARFSARELGLGSSLRDQAYAEFTAVDAGRVMRIPDSITDLDACSLEPLAFAVHSVRISGLALGDRALTSPSSAPGPHRRFSRSSRRCGPPEGSSSRRSHGSPLPALRSTG